MHLHGSSLSALLVLLVLLARPFLSCGRFRGAPPLAESCTRTCSTVCSWKSDRSTQQPNKTTSKRLAVFVVGLRSRFYPLPIMRHIVAPAVKDGYEVDYFAYLGSSAATKFNYSDHAAYWYQPTENPRFENFTAQGLESYLVHHARHFGASRSVVLLRDHDGDVEIPTRPNRSLFRESPGRTLRSLLHFRDIENLWKWTQEHGFRDYDMYVLMFDDVYFIDDIDMTRFVDPGSIYTKAFGALCKDCSREKSRIDDRVVIIGGHVAHRFMTFYSEYLYNPSVLLDGQDSPESYMQALARVKKIPWTIIPKSYVPFFTALHRMVPGRSRPLLCFRGLNSEELNNPTDDCVGMDSLLRAAAIEPQAILGNCGAKIIPFCDDFPMQ